MENMIQVKQLSSINNQEQYDRIESALALYDAQNGTNLLGSTSFVWVSRSLGVQNLYACESVEPAVRKVLHDAGIM